MVWSNEMLRIALSLVFHEVIIWKSFKAKMSIFLLKNSFILSASDNLPKTAQKNSKINFAFDQKCVWEAECRDIKRYFMNNQL